VKSRCDSSTRSSRKQIALARNRDHGPSGLGPQSSLASVSRFGLAVNLFSTCLNHTQCAYELIYERSIQWNSSREVTLSLNL
jgi:hypothetical protein